MKKKTRAAACGAAKRRKTPPPGEKVGRAGARAAVPRPPAASSDAKATIRRLKRNWRGRGANRGVAGLGRDRFPAGYPNRRGFERELHRAIAYIKRYRPAAR